MTTLLQIKSWRSLTGQLQPKHNVKLVVYVCESSKSSCKTYSLVHLQPTATNSTQCKIYQLEQSQTSPVMQPNLP